MGVHVGGDGVDLTERTFRVRTDVVDINLGVGRLHCLKVEGVWRETRRRLTGGRSVSRRAAPDTAEFLDGLAAGVRRGLWVCAGEDSGNRLLRLLHSCSHVALL